MPLSPTELRNNNEKNEKIVEQAFSIIDEVLTKRYNGQPVYISTSILPTLNLQQRQQVIEAYGKAGWSQVHFDSDRDGSFICLRP